MTLDLNRRAAARIDAISGTTTELGIEAQTLSSGGRVFDFGINARGGLEAGLAIADICMAGLGRVSLAQRSLVQEDGGKIGWPHVSVTTDQPVAACLLSQYAGWQIGVGKFFAMGSGPMRAVSAGEELFGTLDYRESSDRVVGVLETSTLPDAGVFEYIAEKCRTTSDNVDLLVAPTSSMAGNLQVVARSVETALHKLFELGFDVGRIRSGCGSAPLSPVARDDLAGIGRTNDAILYGGRVTLWVSGDDESLAEIGPQVPASASDVYGRPFLEIFEQANRDFYAIDPLLFSPAEITFQNVETGRVQSFGSVNHDVLGESFGL